MGNNIRIANPMLTAPAPIAAHTTIRRSSIPLEASPGAHLVLWMFYAFVFSLPFETLDVGVTSSSLSFSKLVGYGFILSTVFLPRVCYRRPPPEFGYFAMYFAIFTLAGIWSAAPFLDCIVRLSSLLQLLALFWIAYNLMRYARVRTAAIVTLVASCLLLAGLQLAGVTATAHKYGQYERISALAENVNEVGAVFALGMVSLVGLVYGGRAVRGSFIAWPIFGVLGICLVRTGSRGAMLGLAVGILAILVRTGRALGRLQSIVIATAVLGAMFWLSYESDVVRSRWELTLSRGSLAGRERIYPAAWEMITERPVMGWGPVNNKAELGRRLGRPTRDTHDLVLAILTEVGILGAVPFFGGLWVCLRAAWRARGGVQGVLPFSLIATGLALNIAGTHHFSKWFWVVLAYALASGRYATVAKGRAPVMRARFVGGRSSLAGDSVAPERGPT